MTMQRGIRARGVVSLVWVADASGADSTRVESIRVVRVWYIHRRPMMMAWRRRHRYRPNGWWGLDARQTKKRVQTICGTRGTETGIARERGSERARRGPETARSDRGKGKAEGRDASRERVRGSGVWRGREGRRFPPLENTYLCMSVCKRGPRVETVDERIVPGGSTKKMNVFRE